MPGFAKLIKVVPSRRIPGREIYDLKIYMQGENKPRTLTLKKSDLDKLEAVLRSRHRKRRVDNVQEEQVQQSER